MKNYCFDDCLITVPFNIYQMNRLIIESKDAMFINLDAVIVSTFFHWSVNNELISRPISTNRPDLYLLLTHALTMYRIRTHFRSGADVEWALSFSRAATGGHVWEPCPSTHGSRGHGFRLLDGACHGVPLALATDLSISTLQTMLVELEPWSYQLKYVPTEPVPSNA